MLMVQRLCKMILRLWKMAQEVLIKFNICPLYDTAIPLVGIFPKGMNVMSPKMICTRIFIKDLFIIGKRLATT